MKQVIQNASVGRLEVASLPEPLALPGCVLVANQYSVISAGTERMVRQFAQKSLLAKAKERPDHVRRVLEKMRSEGVWTTLRQVREKLDEPMPLGYCSAGIVLACGAGVQHFKPGDRVASNGPHAEVVCVPKHLCAHVDDSTPLDHAAFAVLGAIALQGVRLSRLTLGENALVIGLGLIGQLTVALLKSAGARVLGVDPDPRRCALAMQMGADLARPGLRGDDVLAATRNLGADAVLITASTSSDGPVELAGEAVRQKGRVVAVGAVGMNLPRRPYYFKEAEFVVSCSYGPGRYDPRYEDQGQDYPHAYVRWTEQRNMQAVLDQMAAGRLDVSPLISHRFRIDDAAQAYELIESGADACLGVMLEYPERRPEAQFPRVASRAGAAAGEIGLGCLGAGNFAKMVLLPNLCSLSGVRPVAICSASARSAEQMSKKLGFALTAGSEQEVFAHPDVDAVFITTRHDDHARQVLEGLRGGKHVFVEKPLCLTGDELARIEATLAETACRGDQLLMVGFNRRFSPAARAVRDFFVSCESPKTISIRFNAGALPPDHWTQNERIGGGRIIGEACHAIDLAIFLAGAPAVRVFAESVGGAHAPEVTDDQCFITLRHANGSLSNVAYLAGGDKAYPKERVEVFGGGRVAVIDDFRMVEGCAGGKRKRLWRGAQDKGHRAELEAFMRAAREGGDWPIPWDELRSTTLAAILAVHSLREGYPFEIPSSVLAPASTATFRNAG